jgi:arachidonate 15-lipoxygenase
MWFVRKWFWNTVACAKFALNKPFTVPPPTGTGEVIKPVPLSEAIPGLPIYTILTCHPRDIPADERARAKALVYKFQVWLYSAFPPMQPGLPPVDADPIQALKQAYTWMHRTEFDPPVLPAEYYGSPDLGSLAVRGPYAGYTERDGDGIYKWDLGGLGRYKHHEGLRKLGAKVLFRVDPNRRGLQAFQIDTALGSARPGDATWELSKQIALCTVSTHTSLVRHFNWVHLAGGAYLAIATRNRLSPTHPLFRLLWPYIYATEQNGDMVTRGQMLQGGDFETTFSFTFDGMCRLFEESHREFRMVVNDPEEDGKERQIRGQGFDIPTQENLEALFKVMHEHAGNYLRIYYPEAAPGMGATTISDASILAWLDQLNELIPNGVGVSRSNVTFDGLARLVARIMYMVTVQHEILGGGLWNYQLWTHRQPVRVYIDGKREPLDVYQRLVNANYNLNVRRRELMYDFSYLALDPPGKAAFMRFIEDLKALQASMEEQPWVVWKLYPKALKVNINA